MFLYILTKIGANARLAHVIKLISILKSVQCRIWRFFFLKIHKLGGKVFNLNGDAVKIKCYRGKMIAGLEIL